MRKTLCILLLLLALAAPALAQTQVDEVRTQIGENYVAYPQLTGMADEAVQKKINDDIVLSSGQTSGHAGHAGGQPLGFEGGLPGEIAG